MHNGAYLFLLLFSFQFSFFLWTKLSLFLLFLFAFIFTSFISHIWSSVIENECSALRFLVFKQGTPRPTPGQVPSAKVCHRTSALGSKADITERFYRDCQVKGNSRVVEAKTVYSGTKNQQLRDCHEPLKRAQPVNLTVPHGGLVFLIDPAYPIAPSA